MRRIASLAAALVALLPAAASPQSFVPTTGGGAGGGSGGMSTAQVQAQVAAALTGAGIYGTGQVVEKTGDFTVAAADRGGFFAVNSASPVTITFSADLPANFTVTIMQTGAGQASIAPASGGVVLSRQGFTKTAGQYAIVSVLVLSNPGGAPQMLLTGDGSL